MIGFKYCIYYIGCRSFSRVGLIGVDMVLEMCFLLFIVISVVDVMEELGYSCIVDIDYCRGVFGLFFIFIEIEVVCIFGMVV